MKNDFILYRVKNFGSLYVQTVCFTTSECLLCLRKLDIFLTTLKVLWSCPCNTAKKVRILKLQINFSGHVTFIFLKQTNKTEWWIMNINENNKKHIKSMPDISVESKLIVMNIVPISRQVITFLCAGRLLCLPPSIFWFLDETYPSHSTFPGSSCFQNLLLFLFFTFFFFLFPSWSISF